MGLKVCWLDRRSSAEGWSTLPQHGGWPDATINDLDLTCYCCQVSDPVLFRPTTQHDGCLTRNRVDIQAKARRTSSSRFDMSDPFWHGARTYAVVLALRTTESTLEVCGSVDPHGPDKPTTRVKEEGP